MISVEARKYLGKYCVLIREWDGYDHPNYTPIFNITEEELEFEGGRFIRKEWMPINNTELLIAVPDLPAVTNIEDTINWVAENTSKKWNFEIFESYDPQFIWKFHFESEKDAVAFKLRWSKGKVYESYPGKWQ